jgi:hypothetical protein
MAISANQPISAANFCPKEWNGRARAKSQLFLIARS